MVEEKKEEKEVKQEQPKDVLTKAWKELFFEGITEDFFFWCKGYTRGPKHTTLIDTVTAPKGVPRDRWKYEGSVEVSGPIIIHPIMR